MKTAKPMFRRQESWRYKRVAENWRRPRGVTSKMRKEESGFPAKVKVGYRSASSTRNLHPRGLVERFVWRESDLEKLDPKIDIVRISRRVGERKRLGIVAKAKDHNFHIANPGKEESRPITETSAQKASTVETETPVAESEKPVKAAENEEEEPKAEEESE